MNRAASTAIEANITLARIETPEEKRKRAAVMAALGRRSDPEVFSWMEEDQLDAEMEFMIAEMANKRHREYRRSINQ